MSDCPIGCIVSDDEGRGYYCDECPEMRKRDSSGIVDPDGFTRPRDCSDCGHIHTPSGCMGSPTPSDLWAGVNPSDCDCDRRPDPRVTEFQRNALEMSRQAAQAERRAEEAEYHIEQLRDALCSAERIGERAAELATERDAALARIACAERLIDSWERDAPGHSNPVFIGRLRECLRRDPAPVRLRGQQCDCVGRLIETNAHQDTCPAEQERWNDAEYVASWEAANPCDHDWLDRPESDTRECLICGTEATG